MTNLLRIRLPLVLALCATAILPATLAWAEELEDHNKKSFSVRPGGTLNFFSDYGAVSVKPGDSQAVTIQLDRRVHAFTVEEARKILDDLMIDTTQDGNNIHYRAKFKTGWEEAKGWHDSGFCHDHRCLTYARNLRQMDFSISVPQQFNLALTTAGGHMEIGDMDGKLQVQTSGGHLNMGNIGGGVYATTAGGHIELESAKAAVELRTAGGHIRCGHVDGDVKAHTTGGSITLGKVRGSVEAETAGGSIDIFEAEGAIRAKTVGGHVEAKIAGQPQSDSYLETLGGGITLYLPADIRATLEARNSSYGSRIHSEFPITMDTLSGSELKGTINGGGPTIVLHNQFGSIQVRKNSL